MDNLTYYKKYISLIALDINSPWDSPLDIAGCTWYHMAPVNDFQTDEEENGLPGPPTCRRAMEIIFVWFIITVIIITYL